MIIREVKRTNLYTQAVVDYGLLLNRRNIMSKFGFSWSWKRALGISGATAAIARATDIIIVTDNELYFSVVPSKTAADSSSKKDCRKQSHI